MNKIKQRWRVRRAAQAVTATVALVVGFCAGTGAVHAEDDPVLAPSSSFKLTAAKDLRGDVAAGLAANNNLDPVNLSSLPLTGTGKAGLCYPEPFHPGVHADGYCWNNSDDSGLATPGAPDRWTPQGISIPHSASVDNDGYWPATGSARRRWEVVSWHNNKDYAKEPWETIKFRFVDRSQATPRWVDVLPVTVDRYGNVSTVTGHGDSVVWYGDNLIMGTGYRLEVYSLSNLQRNDYPATTRDYQYVLPLTLQYWTTATERSCTPLQGLEPCLTSLSFDRENSSLVSSEWQPRTVNGVVQSPKGRIVRWPFNQTTWLPKSANGSEVGDSYASAAWYSNVLGMQGAVYTGGHFYISGECPNGWNLDNSNGYRKGAASCIFKAAPGTSVYLNATVLTMAPDMSQNLDWDANRVRLRGISEVIQDEQDYPQRLVFELNHVADYIPTFRLKNVHSGKCLVPYLNGLKDNLTVMQVDCSGKIAQGWYEDGNSFRNFQSKRCLSVKDGSSADNAVLVQFECRNYPTQNWGWYSSNVPGGFLLKNLGSGKCATPYNSSALDTHAVQWPCYVDGRSHAWYPTY
ncbi:RICIN domain-containing protein [Streptomyces sp. NPDC048629]|uniref:RICIN domain-containing protein n=1 Tax=Streptomyces sp. NPDC048629 TaxID=3154824 RepID=UPI003436E58F